MFDRYDSYAKSVVSLARDSSRALNHNYIGTEHVLLGLIKEARSPAAKALESAGVTFEDVVAFIDAEIGRGLHPSEGDPPFTPRVKYLLENALVVALDSGVDTVAPLHILLALTRMGDGYGLKSLLYCGGHDIERLRRDAVTRAASQKARALQLALEKAQANVESIRLIQVAALHVRDQAIRSGSPTPQARVDELAQLLLDAEALRDLLGVAAGKA